MHNILQIIRDDWNSLKTNVIAWIVLVGLVAVPPLYAWFNISASWDPYENTGNLKIAVANTDKGYNGTLSPITINMGEMLISSIRENSSFNWIITDEEKALDGVKSGDYYAALVIPETFSVDMMSLFSDDTRNATIKYYSNEKENAIASTVTGKGADAIQKKINQTFTSTLAEIALGTIQNIADDTGGEQVTSNAVGEIVGRLRSAGDTLGVLAENTDAISSMLGSLVTLIDATQDASVNTDSVTDKLRSALNDMDVASEIAAIASALPDGELKTALNEICDNLNLAKSSASDALNSLDNAGDKLASATDGTKSSIKSLRSTLDRTTKQVNATRGQLLDLADRLEAALESGDMETLRKILGEDAGTISAFITEPVGLEEHEVYPITNYGSAMAPFYTSLALWVGGTIMVSMMLVELNEERKRKLRNLKYYQEYIGRYVLFLIIGTLQALLICGGDIGYLGIQCEHPFKFVFAGVVASIVFVNLAYTLTASFGNIGKAICVILLVIQVAGSGGTFPIEMLPGVFSKIYPFLPFAHSMTAMREAIAGTYGNVYWKELGILQIYLAFSLVLGLVLRLPVVRLSRAFQEKLEDVKIMG